MSEPKYIIRPGIEDDHRWVLSSWKQTWRHGQPLLDLVSKSVYYGIVNGAIDELLARSELTVICDPEDPTYLLAWVAYDEEAVHYCYTRSLARHLGLQQQLFDAVGVKDKPFATFATEEGGRLIRNNSLIYKPSLVFERVEQKVEVVRGVKLAPLPEEVKSES